MDRITTSSVPPGAKAGVLTLSQAPQAARTALKQRAVRGAIWTIGTSVGSRAIGLVGTLLLTRYLSPEVYGEVSLAALIVQTAQVFSNCGLSQYIVSKPKEGRAATFHATFFFLVLGALALALTWPFTYFAGPWLFHTRNLLTFLPWLLVAGILERVAIIQDRILVRDMRFRSVGIQRSLGEICYAIVTVTAAVGGAGGFAIVWGALARSTVRIITLSATTPWREWAEPHRITREQTRDFFQFGAPMSVATIFGFASRRFDNFVIAILYGAGPQGIYNMAYNVADIPASQIAETIGDVLVPSFAKMDDARRRSGLLAANRIMSLLVAPLAVGLGLIAPTLVTGVIAWGKTTRWTEVAPMLMVLSVLSVVRPAGWIGSSYLQVKDMPRVIMRLEVAKTVGLLAAMFVLGKLGGPLWACAAVGVAFGANSLSYLWVIRRIDGIPIRAQVIPLVMALAATIPMAAAVYAVRRMWSWLDPPWVAGLSPILPTLLEVVAGAAAFVPSALLIMPTTTHEFIDLLRSVMQRRTRAGRPGVPPSRASAPPSEHG